MQLANLAVPELNLLPAGTETIEITSITADSRAVTPGALFAALPGSRSDGTQFVPQAIASGAVAILAPTDAQLGSVPVPVLRAEDPS
jgi:UDP-N-acetylmuramyl tripeptide synthase